VSGVSVVIPSYNAEPFIRRTLDSVLLQTRGRHRIEIVVVDDGSTDTTPEIVEAMAGNSMAGESMAGGGAPITLIKGPRRGVSAARNEGVRRSSGEYIAFMDHDDLWEPGKIDRQADLLDAHSRAVLVFTQATVERDGKASEIFPVLPDPAAFLEKAYENLVHWNYIPMSAVMLRRSALPEPAFDPRYKLAEDWDLWLRIASKAGDGGVRFIAEPLTRYMIVQGRATERMADLRLEDISIFNEQLRLHPWLSTSDPRRCRRTLHRLHEEAGYWLLKEGRRAEARRALGAAWRIQPASLKPLGRLIASFLGGATGEAAR
jgi:glycosyltransferase involved in cell wall biosynthesis